MSISIAIRPCNSYDLFFQLEREYILQIVLGCRPTIPSDDAFDAKADACYDGPPLPSRYGKIVLPSDWYVAAAGSRVPIDADDDAFARDPMTRRISEAWSEADDEIRIFCSAASAALLSDESSLDSHGSVERKTTRRKRGDATGRKRSGNGKKTVKFASDCHSILCSSCLSSSCGDGNGRQADFKRRSSEQVSWDDLDDAITEGLRSSVEDIEQSVIQTQQSLEESDRSGGGCVGTHHPRRVSEEVSWDDLDDALEEGLRRSLEDLNSGVVGEQERRLSRFMTSNKSASCREVTFDL